MPLNDSAMRTPYLAIFTVLLLILAPSDEAEAQNVSINLEGLPGHGSSILDVSSSDRGVLLPRMTQAERNAIPSPAEGLLVYQVNETRGFYVFSNGAWQAVSGGAAEVDTPELFNAFSTDFLVTGNAWAPVPGMTVSVTIPPGKSAKAQVIADIGLITNGTNNNNHSCTDMAIVMNGALLPDAGYKRVTAGTGATSTHNNHFQNPVVTGHVELTAGTYNFSLFAIRTCNGGNTRTALLGGDNTSLLQGSIAVQLIYD